MLESLRPDPTFYPSPRIAMEAPQERLAYTLLLSPDHSKPDALAVVEKEDVDVALLDYALTDCNSDDLQDALETRHIPFVVLTGYPRVLVRRDRQQKVLSKPVSADLLRMSLRAAAAGLRE